MNTIHANNKMPELNPYLSHSNYYLELLNRQTLKMIEAAARFAEGLLTDKDPDTLAADCLGLDRWAYENHDDNVADLKRLVIMQAYISPVC